MNKVAVQNLYIISIYSLCLLIAFCINNIINILTKNKKDVIWFNIIFIVIIVIVVIIISVKANVTIVGF